MNSFLGSPQSKSQIGVECGREGLTGLEGAPRTTIAFVLKKQADSYPLYLIQLFSSRSGGHRAVRDSYSILCISRNKTHNFTDFQSVYKYAIQRVYFSRNL